VLTGWGRATDRARDLADDVGLDLEERPAKKGSLWALFFAGGQLAAADYYPDLSGPLP
jgi:hypothetical protein